MEDSMRRKHIERLNTGRCTVNSGLIFIDVVHSFEKIGDHAINVTEAILGRK
jgi:phosphate:Na+ symporter